MLVHPVLCRDGSSDDDSKADSKSLRPVFGRPDFESTDIMSYDVVFYSTHFETPS